MTEELMLSAEQGLAVIAVLVPILIWLIRKPIIVKIEVPEVEEKQPERDLRYLQIKKYYGG